MKAPFVPTDSWNIIALDPSTDWTGAVLLHVPFEGTPSVLQFTAISGDWSLEGEDISEPRRKATPEQRLRSVVDRIDRTAFHLRGTVNQWKQDLDGAIDLVAFEDNRYMPGVPGGSKTTEAMVAAIYHYLAIPQFRGAAFLPITRMSACSAAGPGAIKIFREPAGKSEADKREKRERLKEEVKISVMQKLGVFLPFTYGREHAEAVCDAAAVGLAAGAKLIEAEKLARAEAAQPKMALRKTPVRKAKVAA